MYIFLFWEKPISVITIKCLSFSFIYDQRSCHSTPSAVLWVSIAVCCNAWGDAAQSGLWSNQGTSCGGSAHPLAPALLPAQHLSPP